MAFTGPGSPRLHVEQLEERHLLSSGGFLGFSTSLLPTLASHHLNSGPVKASAIHRHFPRRLRLASLTPGQQLLYQQLSLHRQQSGLPLLTINPLLMAAAQGHADNMAQQDKYGDSGTDGHILDGHDVVWRVTQVGYRFAWLGENVAYNQYYPNPAQTLADQWWNSPPHRANMLEPLYTEIGVGIATGASGRTYGVEVFARPVYG
jgi:hypothetical protein